MLKIHYKKSPELYTKSAEVLPNSDVKELVSEMFALMYANEGIGLAANQVGILQRIIVVDINSLKSAIINPVIIKTKLGLFSSIESCLSFPGAEVKMQRHKLIVVEGFDENWEPVKMKLRGLASACIQHEIDHLNGVTIK